MVAQVDDREVLSHELVQDVLPDPPEVVLASSRLALGVSYDQVDLALIHGCFPPDARRASL